MTIADLMNMEFEIIEEPKEVEIPEHYDLADNPDIMNNNLIGYNFQKINEELKNIIDYLKEKEEKEGNK